MPGHQDEESILHRCLRWESVELPRSPARLLAAFSDLPGVALLENPGVPSSYGRYAFVAIEPFWQFKSRGLRAWAGPPGALEPLSGSPFAELAALLERQGGDATLQPSGLPPFCGGAVGYIGYDCLHLIEEVPATGSDDLALPDMYFSFYDCVYAYDLVEGTSFILATGLGATRMEAERRASARLQQGRRTLAARCGGSLATDDSAASEAYRESGRQVRRQRPQLQSRHLAERGIVPRVSRSEYLASIEQVKDEIWRGNAFEVCLTQRFDVPVSVDGWDIYQVLRAINPTPMSAYLRFPGLEVLSASPERFLSLDRQRVAETRPIKGTRPRARDPEVDRALRRELLASDKDRAENLMIVDLARNDLGRVCELGSVEVRELCAVEAYPYTWQMVSTVRGRLERRYSAVDLVRAMFPGGSMTGAPKVEAMKIIDRLEPTRRGVYAGAIGYFDFDGAVDLSIVIRTMIKKGDTLTFHVGGAIVADSVAEDEYQETLDKAHGLVTALDVAQAWAPEPDAAGGGR